METKIKERSKGNSPFGMLKNVEALYQRFTKKSTIQGSEAGLVDSIPFEVSQEARVHRAKVELRRFQAFSATQRQNLRGR